MAAIVCPDEEEMYLLAILSESDGLDLAEWSWHDSESADGIYRAWDFQWPWYTCRDMQQVDQGGRALGKTVSITMRAFAFPFTYPGQKMLITAPELNHLRPLTDAIENRLLNTRLVRELLPEGRTHGMNRQPHWQAKFKNGAMLTSRLPQKDGKGVKGQHVIQIELDEAQDYPLAGWIEIMPTLNAGLPGAMFRCHGVPKGTRDKFYEKTEPNSGWTVHRPMAMNRPTWSAVERDNNIQEYGGSRQNIDYKRNIYGEHGDASNSVFVLSRLMACVDIDEASEYNSEVYTVVRMEYERFPTDADDVQRTALIHTWLDIPGTHKSGWSQKVGNKEVGAPRGYSAYWAGMDVGVTNHPSEILVFGQRQGSDHLDLLLRVQMQRINADDQKATVQRIFELYGEKLRSFAIDKTGVGFMLWDELTRYPVLGDRIEGFNFSENRVVAFEDRPLEGRETMADLAIKRNVVEATTDWLRNDYVDTKSIRLPFDRELLLEFQGQTYTVIKDNGTPYGTKRQFGGGSFHTLDAAKMVMAGKHIPPLEAILDRGPDNGPVLDLFLGM
jgi:hypothetical protein